MQSCPWSTARPGTYKLREIPLIALNYTVFFNACLFWPLVAISGTAPHLSVKPYGL